MYSDFANKLRAKVAADSAKAAADAERKIHVAEAFATVAGLADAAGDRLPEPSVLGASYKGTAGTLWFRDCAPDTLLRLVRWLEPEPRYRAKHPGYGASLYPVVEVEANRDKYETLAETDGIELRASGGHGYGQLVSADWFADLPGSVRVHVHAEVRAVHGVTPSIRPGRTVTTSAGEFVRFEGTDTLNAPIPVPAGCHMQRYARGSGTALQNFMVSGTVVEWLEAWAAECERRGRHSRAAYLSAAATVPVAIPPLVVDNDTRDAYNRESLRAGTLEQFAALRMPHAIAERELAERHWQEFRADLERMGADGIADPPSWARGYFDYSTWACAYLKRAGLYVVERDGKPYKYGSAWL